MGRLGTIRNDILFHIDVVPLKRTNGVEEVWTRRGPARFIGYLGAAPQMVDRMCQFR
jgi:hypothetical protein